MDNPSSGGTPPEQPRASGPLRSGVGEVWQLFRLTCLEWWNDDAFRLAAALAFYTIFSIAPLLLIAVLVASVFFTRDAAAHRIENEVQNMVGAAGGPAVGGPAAAPPEGASPHERRE